MNKNTHTNTRDATPAAPAERSPMALPPIPLVSGTVLEADGQQVITGVTLTFTTQRGSTYELPLDYKFGGWWATVDPAVLSAS